MQPNRHWLSSRSMVAQAYHLCSSLLIRVHLRFHFLLPEQARNRRGGTIVISGETTIGRRSGLVAAGRTRGSASNKPAANRTGDAKSGPIAQLGAESQAL